VGIAEIAALDKPLVIDALGDHAYVPVAPAPEAVIVATLPEQTVVEAGVIDITGFGFMVIGKVAATLFPQEFTAEQLTIHEPAVVQLTVAAVLVPPAVTVPPPETDQV
jgi:hypothetical protein